jgi:hypothetical protein
MSKKRIRRKGKSSGQQFRLCIDAEIIAIGKAEQEASAVFPPEEDRLAHIAYYIRVLSEHYEETHIEREREGFRVRLFRTKRTGEPHWMEWREYGLSADFIDFYLLMEIVYSQARRLKPGDDSPPAD